MTTSLYERWAEVLVEYSTAVGPEDQVALMGGVAAEPLLRAIYRAALRKGATVVLMPTFAEAQADLLSAGSDDAIAFISPVERWAIEGATVGITVLASTNTRSLSGTRSCSSDGMESRSHRASSDRHGTGSQRRPPLVTDALPHAGLRAGRGHVDG